MTKMPETTTGWKTKSHQFSLHGILKLATSGRQPGFVASPVGGDSTSGRGGPIGGKNTRAGHGSIQTRDRPFPERDHRQTSLLSNQETAVNLRIQQMTASAGLIEALGGGWNASQLPSPAQLVTKAP
jgi:hypothetical protein